MELSPIGKVSCSCPKERIIVIPKVKAEFDDNDLIYDYNGYRHMISFGILLSNDEKQVIIDTIKQKGLILHVSY